MSSANPWIEDRTIALFVDLYELTMAQAYVAEDMHDEAVFSLFAEFWGQVLGTCY